MANQARLDAQASGNPRPGSGQLRYERMLEGITGRDQTGPGQSGPRPNGTGRNGDSGGY